jgi:signal transduction histidine kinase
MVPVLQLRAIGRFREWPIKQKLMVIIMATTSVALLLAGMGIVLSDGFLFYGYLQRDLSALARIIADNSTAALAFEDPRSATETLNALRARPHLVNACVYRADNTVLARYLRPGATMECPPVSASQEIRMVDGYITATRPVFLEKRRIGTLVLLYDLGEIWDRAKLFGITVVIVLLLSVAMAWLLSSRLRAVVANPVSQLARVATAVSATKDYSIRAQKYSGDELGILVDAFNEMLAGIQSRDNDLRNALSDVQRSNESLARSNEDLERFAFIASHDLQEPLRMITTYSQLLVRQYPTGLDGQGATFVNNIVGGTRRMRALLADLLEYAEIGAGSERPVEAVDLNTVVDKVLLNLKVLVEDSGATITIDRLPIIRAYEAHCLTLFQNLVGNAIKYRSEKPPAITITVRKEQAQIRFAVTDNGIGIEPEYHAKIFVAFKRLHGQKIPGTGIGLAICQRVVERYGGRIWVESRQGQGATFIFTLPNTIVVEAGELNGARIA